MKKNTPWMLALAGAALLSGCSTAVHHKSYAAAPVQAGAKAGEEDASKVQPGRMLIWTARMTIEVGDVTDAAQRASAMAEREGGFVESKSDSGQQSASITLRIPSRKFKETVAAFESLGKVTSQHVEGEDVTEQYVDVEARLKNKIALRDKLKGLLEKAADVKDILAIETELNRVQSDIDSMEGQIKSLRGKADMATLNLTLNRKTIKGPLGYLFGGIWWGIEKLFILRE